MSTRSIAMLASLVILTASAAYASDSCPTVLAEKRFEVEGGTLSFVGPHQIQHPPADFFCDRIQCVGSVEFEGVVNGDGTIHSLHVVRNTWTVKPEYHARISQESIYSWRYVPPRLDGKVVCVKMGWNIEYRVIDEVEKR